MHQRKHTTSDRNVQNQSADIRPRKGNREPPLPESFHLLVQCRDEAEQRDVYNRLTNDGHTCRVLSL